MKQQQQQHKTTTGELGTVQSNSKSAKHYTVCLWLNKRETHSHSSFTIVIILTCQTMEPGPGCKIREVSVGKLDCYDYLTELRQWFQLTVKSSSSQLHPSL